MPEAGWKKHINFIVIAISCICVVMLGAVAWEVDPDSYFMLYEGGRILDSMSIPRVNGASLYGNVGIVIQQWAYCAAMRFFYDLWGWAGTWLFAALQQAVFFVVFVRFVMKMTRDVALSCMLSFLCLLLFNTYYYSMRPETFTLMLLTLECAALEAWRDKKSKAALCSLPVLMFLEANFHGSMVLFHFCILAAYMAPVPGFFKKYFVNKRIRSSVPFFAAIVAMFFAAFLNPYGADIFAYIFRSQGAHLFMSINIKEMQMLRVASLPMISVAMVLAWLIAAVRLKFAETPELFLCAGFLVISAIALHSIMFIIVPCALLARGTAGFVGERSGKTLAELAGPECGRALAILAVPMCAVSAAVLFLHSIPKADAGLSGPSGIFVEAVDYIEEKGGKDAGVLDTFDSGSYLEYRGFTRLMMDGRAELISKSINGSVDIVSEYMWLTFGVGDEAMSEKYGNIGGWFDAHGVDFIIDYSGGSFYAYAYGWISSSTEWQRITVGGADVWERIK